MCSNFFDFFFLGCLPPLTGALFGIDLGFGLLSVDWISLPTATIGLSLLGFLGVCLVLTILFGL